MRFSALVFLLILACVYTLAQGSYEDCCLGYARGVKKGTRRMVTKFRNQVADGGCNIPAVVFTTKRGRVICADPRDGWVKGLTLKLESKKSAIKRKGQRRG